MGSLAGLWADRAAVARRRLAVEGCGACSRLERTMPRRRPVQIRADRQGRLRVSRGPFGPLRVSQFPGLSPHGRCVIARLEHTRLMPRQTEEALQAWRAFMRSPYHRLWDPRYEGCGCWGCCYDMNQVREVLEIVAHHLPHRDARRFRCMVDAVDEEW
jgi:hypothetical protein